MRYVLYAPEQDFHVAVEEWDDLSAEEVHDEFCAPTAAYETRTVAGLSLRFSQGLGAMGTGRYSASERDWVLISDQRVVYEIWVFDDTPGLYADQRKSQNTAVVETFSPQYATRGCA